MRVPGTAFDLKFVRIPGDDARHIPSLWVSTTEITWDAFDAFVYRANAKDKPGDQPPSEARAPTIEHQPDTDADTRPSKPYLPPDRGFGHEGFAAICVTHKSAAAFATWLSQHTGRTFRLPTEDEWEHAARAGGSGRFGMADDPAALATCAVFDANADDAPQRVASKQPNAWGLYDMLGNVREWVDGRDHRPITKGGSYQDPASELEISARRAQDSTWNASDPQIPKSRWWLSDGSFVGFRIVCEVKPAAPVAPTLPSAPAQPEIPSPSRSEPKP